MGSSLFLDNESLSRLAEKVVKARKLYGTDSSYVIGLLTGLDWLMECVESGAKTRELLHGKVLESERGRPAQQSAEGGAGSAQPGEGLVENTWIKGIVKWFNNDKGYGFISTDSHIDVFVHWRDISSWDRSLTQGDEVEFMVTRTAKGFQAINVMKTDQEETQGEQQASGEEAGETGEREEEVSSSAPVPEEEGEKPVGSASGEKTSPEAPETRE